MASSVRPSSRARSACQRIDSAMRSYWTTCRRWKPPAAAATVTVSRAANAKLMRRMSSSGCGAGRVRITRRQGGRETRSQGGSSPCLPASLSPCLALTAAAAQPQQAGQRQAAGGEDQRGRLGRAGAGGGDGHGGRRQGELLRVRVVGGVVLAV